MTLSDREKMMEFLTAIACGSAAREVIREDVHKITVKEMVDLAIQYKETNKLNMTQEEFVDLVADIDSILDHTCKIMMHLVTKGHLFKEDFNR